MPMGFGISKIIFKGGDTVVVPAGALVTVVGPNNAGKTLLLRELHDNLGQDHSPNRLIERVERFHEGDEAAARALADRDNGGTPRPTRSVCRHQLGDER